MWIGRRLITLEIDVGGYKHREEVLKWLDFPVRNPMNKYHVLTPKEGRIYIDSNSTSLDELLEMLPDSRRNAEEITRIAEEKMIDSAYAFSASKVREMLSCGVCNVPL